MCTRSDMCFKKNCMWLSAVSQFLHVCFMLMWKWYQQDVSEDGKHKTTNKMKDRIINIFIYPSIYRFRLVYPPSQPKTLTLIYTVILWNKKYEILSCKLHYFMKIVIINILPEVHFSSNITVFQFNTHFISLKTKLLPIC